MQVSASAVFPFRRNQPDGSRAFALLRARIAIMRTPERLLRSRMSSLSDFSRPERRIRTSPRFSVIGWSFQCRVSKERASNPEIACAVKYRITREASGECGTFAPSARVFAAIGPVLAYCRKFRFSSITHCFRRAFKVLSPESSRSHPNNGCRNALLRRPDSALSMKP